MYIVIDLIYISIKMMQSKMSLSIYVIIYLQNNRYFKTETGTLLLYYRKKM